MTHLGEICGVIAALAAPTAPGYAAGSLIFCEAGGALCTLEDDDFWAAPVWSRSVIAARTPELLGEWRDWVRSHG